MAAHYNTDAVTLYGCYLKKRRDWLRWQKVGNWQKKRLAADMAYFMLCVGKEPPVYVDKSVPPSLFIKNRTSGLPVYKSDIEKTRAGELDFDMLEETGAIDVAPIKEAFKKVDDRKSELKESLEVSNLSLQKKRGVLSEIARVESIKKMTTEAFSDEYKTSTPLVDFYPALSKHIRDKVVDAKRPEKSYLEALLRENVEITLPLMPVTFSSHKFFSESLKLNAKSSKKSVADGRIEAINEEKRSTEAFRESIILERKSMMNSRCKLRNTNDQEKFDSLKAEAIELKNRFKVLCSIEDEVMAEAKPPNDFEKDLHHKYSAMAVSGLLRYESRRNKAKKCFETMKKEGIIERKAPFVGFYLTEDPNKRALVGCLENSKAIAKKVNYLENVGKNCEPQVKRKKRGKKSRRKRVQLIDKKPTISLLGDSAKCLKEIFKIKKSAAKGEIRHFKERVPGYDSNKMKWLKNNSWFNCERHAFLMGSDQQQEENMDDKAWVEMKLKERLAKIESLKNSAKIELIVD